LLHFHAAAAGECGERAAAGTAHIVLAADETKVAVGTVLLVAGECGEKAAAGTAHIVLAADETKVAVGTVLVVAGE